MKLVVGLGNPGNEYEKTRHNIGFRVIDAIKKSPWCKIRNSKIDKKFNSEITACEIDNEKYLLIKPQTFMNNSGEAIKAVMSYYKIKPKDIIVALDDIDLVIGKVRIRFGGSSGGHKGLESIINHLETDKFWRVRFGIDNKSKINLRPELRSKENQKPKRLTERFVLAKFSKKEEKIINKIIHLAINEKLEEKTINFKK